MENENYTAYDLEGEVARDPGVSEIPQASRHEKPAEDPHSSDNGESTALSCEQGAEAEGGVPAGDEARGAIESMISEMGAEKVLAIILNNRNAVITQIMHELENHHAKPIPTGVRADSVCTSIFELAEMA